MTDVFGLYTYRNNKKIQLEKINNQFIVRDSPESVCENLRIENIEQLSSNSTRVTCLENELEPLMSLARSFAPTHHAYRKISTKENLYITDRVFVSFVRPLSEYEIDVFSGKYSLWRIKSFNSNLFLFRLTKNTGMNPIKLVSKLYNDPLVYSVEHDLNHIMIQEEISIPEEEKYREQWHLHTRQPESELYDHRSSTRCEEAWKEMDSYGDPNVVIAVLDNGCHIDSSEFNNKLAGWAYSDKTETDNYVLFDHENPNAIRAKMYQQGVNHGTSCAAVAAASVNGNLTVGSAPGCKILPIRYTSPLGIGIFVSDSLFLETLEYLSDKADVVSCSWGTGGPEDLFDMNIIYDQIKRLSETGGRRGKGIVFLWAAGNENCPVIYDGDIEVPYTSGWTGIFGSPTAEWSRSELLTSNQFRNRLVGISNVLLISAISSTAKRSHYSRYGDGISICAPSNNYHRYFRLTPEGYGIQRTPPSGIVTTSGPYNEGGPGTVIKEFGGTSSATPLVAGIAALVISVNPDLAADKVVSILKKTASKDLDFGGYEITPPLLPIDPNPAEWDVSPIPPWENGEFLDQGLPEGSWSPWFGHGKVDALLAVQEAARV